MHFDKQNSVRKLTRQELYYDFRLAWFLLYEFIRNFSGFIILDQLHTDSIELQNLYVSCVLQNIWIAYKVEKLNSPLASYTIEFLSVATKADKFDALVKL